MGEWGNLVQSNIRGLPRGPALIPFCDYLLELLPSFNDVSELLLQLLVGKVDAKLLKAVLLKDLETENIQNANGPLSRSRCAAVAD